MPIKVIDKATQKEIEVSSAELQSDIVSGRGKYVVPEGRVRVQMGKRTGTTDTKDLAKVFAGGGRLIDDAEAAQARLEAEESGVVGQALGTIEAGAATATFGLSSLAEEALGADPKRMKARREAAGTLADVAGVAGYLVPGLGVAGAVGKGAKATLGARALGVTPVGLATRGGALVERGLASTLSRAPALVRTTVPVAGRGAVEGFAAGVGQEIDESVLGERTLTGERLWSAGKMGGLFGGVGGAVVPGALAVGAGIGKATVAPIRSVLGRAWATGADDAGVGMIGRIAADPKLQRAYAIANNLDPEDVALTFGSLRTPQEAAEFMEILNSRAAYSERIAADLRPATERMQAARAPLRAEFSHEAKLRHVERNLPSSTDELVRARDAGLQQLDGFRTRIRGALDEHDGGLVEYHRPDLLRLDKMATQADTEIQNAIAEYTGKRGAKQIAAVVHRELDRLKQGADQVVRSNRKVVPNRATDNTLELLSGPDGAVSGLRAHLADESVWHKVGADQRRINEVTAAAIRAEEMLTGSSKRVLAGEFVDNGDLLRIVQQSGRFSGSTKTELLEDAIAARQAQYDTMEELLDLAPATKAQIAEYRAARKEMLSSFERQRDKVAKMDAVDRMRATDTDASPTSSILSSAGTTILSMAGLGLGGPVGGMLGAAAGILTRPTKLLRTLGAIQARSAQAAARESKAIGRFTKQITDGDTAAGKASGKLDPPAKARAERVAEVRKTVSSYTTNPAAFDDHLRKATLGIDDVAPLLAAKMHEQARVAAVFLASKIPQGYKAPYSNSEPLTDPMDEMRFANYVEAVDDPDGSAERLADGTFTMEHAEALHAVWPAKFAELRNQVLTAIGKAAESGHEILSSVASELEILFAIPLTPATPLAAPPPDESAQVAAAMSSPAKVPANFDVGADRLATPVGTIGRME